MNKNELFKMIDIALVFIKFNNIYYLMLKILFNNKKMLKKLI